ncbi:SDR family oxidoreductase [Sinomicrobium soli]|uniref:SDR family oxidoreductase n=1 Tax=Sinomicrobium sp. N-1-3-6 TaxID=2219864 RepID=UPI000DCB1B77|nr:SDR family oxidoreductase [Sinomicrobium sp. N-1-3-6]RAV28630.1 NAD(P)-dependent oxidoreductase [Sinomicrobium sp. N-1-3-6]
MNKPHKLPPQRQSQPGREHKMHPRPEVIREGYRGSGKLEHKVALITGGDSGIGRSIAVHYAREGASVCIVYLEEDKDAEDTREMVEKEGQECLIIPGNLAEEHFCREVVDQCISKFDRLDIVINNAAVQHARDEVAEISFEQLKETFETNIYPCFSIVREALPHLKEGASIINTTSVTAYRGSDHLLDYASTKGAIVSFTRALSKMLAKKKIRVNGVAPGPIWTPLIPATLDHVETFGKNTPLGRPGQPGEVAPAYVFLGCGDSSYITGQIIHINGGEIIGS